MIRSFGWAGTLHLLVAGMLFHPTDTVADNPDSGFPKSPEIREDRTVTFRIKASEARQVAVKGGFAKGKLALEKSEGGLWQGTVGPVDPGIYDYSFEVDGTYTLDPLNRWLKGWRSSANLFEVPADPPAVWQRGPGVARGVVHRHSFFSEPLQSEREVFVYTPPGYAEETEREYPVLYLLHGSGDDASAWTNVGRAHVIADNLIAAGKCEPLVIVMPYGHGHRPGTDLSAFADRGEWYRENNKAVFEDFFQSVVPLAENAYRLKKGPDDTAIAGLSMGGGQSLELGLNHPERFGWVAGFSSATPTDEAATIEPYRAFDPTLSRRKVWIGCGRADSLLERNDFFHGWLERKGLVHDYVLTEGGHAWPVWRDYLERWLTGLFR
ncbi:MAG: hypothetical protein KDL87_04680 [Verrucomicrobiae bacterium]|nr:hypothetical protein [Verrucomicrobiae bacterium]